MNIRIMGGTGEVTLDRLPYSHMDEADEHLFYDTMEELLTYANQVLHLVDAPRVALHGDDDRALGHGSVVSDALWQRPWIVDDFVRENPLGVSRAHLEVARPWRNAVRDLFTCIGADADAAVYMNAERAFAVGALRGPADQHVHAIPSLVLLTLLPFKGGIVTDSKTLHLADELRPGMGALIERDARRALRRGVVTTSAELIAYAQTHRGVDQISPRFQRIIDEHLSALRDA
ncbi:hypothetical protein [Thermophilibacter sp.]